MPELMADPRTREAFRASLSRRNHDASVGSPPGVGAGPELLLRTLRQREQVEWISWAYEIHDGPLQWWTVALTADRLIGVSPEDPPRVWAAPAGTWTAELLDTDVLIRTTGHPLRVRGGAGSPQVFGIDPSVHTPVAVPAPAPVVSESDAAVAADAADAVDAAPDADLAGTASATDEEGPVVGSWQEAEALAAWHMRQLGFGDAALTVGGADGGLDVTATGAAAQVKLYAKGPIGGPVVQQLRGAATGLDWALFYSSSGYTRSAIEFADSADVALFTFDLSARVQAVNGAARHLVERAGIDDVPDVDQFALEREMKETFKAYGEAAVRIFLATVERALEVGGPDSALFRTADAELQRAKRVLATIDGTEVDSDYFLQQIDLIIAGGRRLSEDIEAHQAVPRPPT